MTKCFAATLCLTVCLATHASAADSPDAQSRSIIAATREGKYEEACELADALASQSPAPAGLADALNEAAGIAGHAKRYAHAARLFRKLSDTFPNFKDINLARSELIACYYYSRQFDESLALIDSEMKRNPNSPSVEYWRFLRAQIPYKTYEYATAKAAFDRYLAKYPEGKYSGHARAYLGRINPTLDMDENRIIRYSGKFERDIRLRTAMQALPIYLDEGFTLLRKKLGVDLRPHTEVVYEFRDKGRKTGGGMKATTRIIAVDNKPTTLVYFYTEAVVTDPKGYHRTAMHELKHAGFIGIMGRAYHDLPEWIREGLAVWGTEAPDRRMNVVLSNAIIAMRDPKGALDGIDDPDHTTRDYMEDVLAFEWLASKDPNNMHEFCRRLLKGEPYRKIWSDLSGMSYTEAIAAANAHCRKRVDEALGNAYHVFTGLRGQARAAMAKGTAGAREWLENGGRTAFEKWLVENPDHPARPMGRVSLAQVLIIAKEYDAARELLSRVLAEDGDRSSLNDDAQFWIGVSYNHQKDHANSKKAFGILLRDYPNSQGAKKIRGQMQPAGPVLH